MLVQSYSGDLAMGMPAILSLFTPCWVLSDLFLKQRLAGLISVKPDKNCMQILVVVFPPPVLKGSFLQGLLMLPPLNCHPDEVSRVLRRVKPHLLSRLLPTVWLLWPVGELIGQTDEISNKQPTARLDSQCVLEECGTP